MRIVKRPELVALPVGTVYCEYYGERPWGFDLNIKMEGEESGWTNDWLYLDLGCIDSDDSDQEFDRRVRMENYGEEFGINKAWARDGLFDDDQRYVVWSKDDVEFMMTWLSVWYTPGDPDGR